MTPAPENSKSVDMKARTEPLSSIKTYSPALFPFQPSKTSVIHAFSQPAHITLLDLCYQNPYTAYQLKKHFKPHSDYPVILPFPAITARFLPKQSIRTHRHVFHSVDPGPCIREPSLQEIGHQVLCVAPTEVYVTPSHCFCSNQCAKSSVDGFKPTMDGPFFREASIHSEKDGSHKKALGLNELYELRKSHHLSSSSKGGRATTEDQQNDSMYLTPVIIGNQQMILDFDTGSSDLWGRSPCFSLHL